MRIDVIQFNSETLAGRRERFAREILTLEDRVEELLADHARMAHAKHSCQKNIRETLAKHFTRLDALIWQQRQENEALRTLENGLG